MDSNQCFYIQSVEHPNLGLTSDAFNEYGSKFQLINVDIHHLENGNNNQKWKYDEDTRKLTTHSHPDKSMLAGANFNVVLFQSRELKNQLFTYNAEIKSWYNEVSHHALQLGGGHNAIIKTKYKNDPEFQWNIVPCADFKELPKTHDPHHDTDSGERGARDIRGHDDDEDEDEDEDEDHEEDSKSEEDSEKEDAVPEKKSGKKAEKKKLEDLVSELKTPKPKEEEHEEKHHKKKAKPTQDEQDKVENEMAKAEIKEPEMPAAHSAEETAADANAVESEISANTEATK